MTAPRTGWSAGTTSGGEWLTILGSQFCSPDLHATAAEATAAIPATLTGRLRDELVVRYVRETWHPGVTGNGRAYRITDPPVEG